MKKLYIVVAMLTAFGGAQAAENTTGVAQKQGSLTNVESGSQSSASNTGNNQTIVFTSPATSTSNINQTVVQSGTTTQNVNQTVSGTQNINQNISGTQTVNSNVNGTTTNIVKQDQNVNSTVNGTQTQIVAGGTNSTIRQEFGTQTIRNTPSVSGPPLTSSNDTCMGSASGSANAPGFGISLGKTYVDDNCKMLKNSRELWNMGMKAASMALMCMDSNNRAALEMTGFVCPQSQPQTRRVSTTTVITERDVALKAGEPVDPIVRQRMGLPAIKE